MFVFEHRQVMEQALGRKLASHESIHHKDGNRANNSIGNLELWSSRHGKGQRVEDKIEFCLSFLKEYPELLTRRGYTLVSNIPVQHAPMPKLTLSEAVSGMAGFYN